MKRPLMLKLKAIEKTKKQLGELRDRLRNQISDLEGIADVCDEAHNLMQDGTRSLSDAADQLSTYL